LYSWIRKPNKSGQLKFLRLLHQYSLHNSNPSPLYTLYPHYIRRRKSFGNRPSRLAQKTSLFLSSNVCLLKAFSSQKCHAFEGSFRLVGGAASSYTCVQIRYHSCWLFVLFFFLFGFQVPIIATVYFVSFVITFFVVPLCWSCLTNTLLLRIVLTYRMYYHVFVFFFTALCFNVFEPCSSFFFLVATVFSGGDQGRDYLDYKISLDGGESRLCCIPFCKIFVLCVRWSLYSKLFVHNIDIPYITNYQSN
jgi:hypothetical protein